MNESPATHCGFIAILGAPNVGKSTLLNRVVGAKVSIVSSKVQTTRTRILGIALVENSQLIFIDTPGIFNPKRRLDRAMIAAAWGGARDAARTSASFLSASSLAASSVAAASRAAVSRATSSCAACSRASACRATHRRIPQRRPSMFAVFVVDRMHGRAAWAWLLCLPFSCQLRLISGHTS